MSVVNTTSAKKWAETMKSIKKNGYLITSVLLTLGLSYFFYSSLNRPVAGVLWFIGGGLIFFYYWIKWFVTQPPPDPDFMTGINACPDYLSVIPNNSGMYSPATPTQYFCVDYVGVSRNGGLKKMDPSKIQTQITDPAYRFSVDPTSDFATPAGKAEFIKRLVKAGLSFNSVGDNTAPTQMTNPNGSPMFS
jgi:hypothetical protein